MKKVLLISPNFFEYHNDLIEEMVNQGFQVRWFDDRPSNNFFDKVFIRVNKKILQKKIEMYFNTILDDCSKENYDIVFIIFGQIFDKNNIRKMREVLPNAKFIYYTWDSVNNFPFITDIYKEFDISYSFDDEDCKQYNMKFLPLFYCNDYKETEIKYDISTILTIKKGKLNNFLSIKNILPSNCKCYHYLYLQSRLVYLFYRFKYKEFKDAKMRDFFYKRLDRQKVYDIFSQSKVVVDCQMQNQIGLTMRTFEVLHLKKKLITTNSNIKKYDFYNPNNVFIVDEDNFKIPNDFIESEFDNSVNDILNDYSISSFINKILGEE